ncbi:hypothetical protein STEG23_004633 [Scotinomys teguina]
MPFNRRMDKENVVIYTMEYYAAEKNNDIMKFAGKWMELENVILSESPDEGLLTGARVTRHSYMTVKFHPIVDDNIVKAVSWTLVSSQSSISICSSTSQATRKEILSITVENSKDFSSSCDGDVKTQSSGSFKSTGCKDKEQNEIILQLAAVQRCFLPRLLFYPEVVVYGLVSGGQRSTMAVLP